MKDFEKIETYRESNYEIVISLLKIGVEDFGIVMGIFLFGLVFSYIIGFVSSYLRLFVFFLFTSLALFLFFLARSYYTKKGRINVILPIIDEIFFSEEVIDGRKKEKY